MWLHCVLWEAFTVMPLLSSLEDLWLLASPVGFYGLIPVPLIEFALLDGDHANRDLSLISLSLQISTSVFWILGNVHLEPVRTWMAPTDAFARLGIVYRMTSVKVRAAGGAEHWLEALKSDIFCLFVCLQLTHRIWLMTSHSVEAGKASPCPGHWELWFSLCTGCSGGPSSFHGALIQHNFQSHWWSSWTTWF